MSGDGWVKAVPFIPACQGEAQPQDVTRCDNIAPGVTASSSDENAAQLSQERSHHIATMQLLQQETARTRLLEKELNESRQQVQYLVQTNQRNTEILHTVMHGIEPKIDQVVKDVASLTVTESFTVHDDASSEIPTRGPLNPVAAVFETTLFPREAPAPPSFRTVDELSFPLYGVLEQGRIHQLDRVPDVRSASHTNVNQVSINSDGHVSVNGDSHNKADHNIQGTELLASSLTEPIAELKTGSSANSFTLKGNQPNRVGLGELQFLDEAFNQDFFCKPGGGSQSGYSSSSQDMAGDSFDDMDDKENRAPHFEVVGLSQKADMSPAPFAISEASDNTGTSGSVDVRQQSIVESPVQNMETRKYHEVRQFTPPKLSEIEKEHDREPRNPSALPTLRLPLTFLEEVRNQRTGSVSSASTILLASACLTGESKLEQAKEAGPLPLSYNVPPFLRMSDRSDSTERTIRPGSAQLREMELVRTRDLELQDDASQGMEDTGIEVASLVGQQAAHVEANHPHEQAINASPPNIRPSTAPEDNYHVIPVEMTNLYTDIKWNMTATRNPPFASDDEKERIQCLPEQASVKDESFWTHPVRYEPAFGQPAPRRTVQIDHIPEECSVRQVLEQVFYGAIQEINLVTIGFAKEPIEGKKTAIPHKFARIVFVDGWKAFLYARYAHNKPLALCGQPVRVYLEPEPTRPMTREIDTAIHAYGLTRILSVFGLSKEARDGLRAFLWDTLKIDDPVRLRKTWHEPQGDGNDHYKWKTVMDFRSVSHAFRAYMAMKDGGHKEAEGFMTEPDYCDAEPIVEAGEEEEIK